MNIKQDQGHKETASLLEKIAVINIGINEFAESLEIQDIPVLHVQWTPPAIDDEELIDILDSLL